MYSTYTHSLYNSSKGETNMYSWSLLLFFFALLAITELYFLYAVISDCFTTRQKTIK